MGTIVEVKVEQTKLKWFEAEIKEYKGQRWVSFLSFLLCTSSEDHFAYTTLQNIELVISEQFNRSIGGIDISLSSLPPH